ncbi:MAG TPA: hypothetical protein VKH44_00515 [Pirellulaceae bacterium]|nr:hypothetical protein [Pirellulaceae bacterium]
MASDARIFLAGVAASFAFLAAAMVFAKPALHDPPENSAPFSGIGLTRSAAAEPATAIRLSDRLPQIQPAKDAQAEKQVPAQDKQLGSESPNNKKDLKAERRKKQAERRAKRKIAQRIRQPFPLMAPQDPAIMASGGQAR